MAAYASALIRISFLNSPGLHMDRVFFLRVRGGGGRKKACFNCVIEIFYEKWLAREPKTKMKRKMKTLDE